MTEQEKRLAAVHHVVHEYANFVSSAEMVLRGTDIYGNGFKPPLNTHVGHAFYLNCRKIADFFLNKRDGDDNIMAEHFAPSFKATLKTFEYWRGPINKQLAHITYARDSKAREIKSPDQQDLYTELQQAWQDFRRQLPEPYRAEFTRKIKERKDPYPNGELSEFRNYDLD
jgi:hypothetical protein